jgi:hypothetical protein
MTTKHISARDKKHATQIAKKMLKSGQKIKELEFVGRKFGMSNYEVEIV